MKRAYLYLIWVLICFTFSACKKDSSSINSLSSVTMVNAINGSSAIITNFSIQNTKENSQNLFQYSLANQIQYATSFETGSYVGNTPISISPASDTLGVYWAGDIMLNLGTSNSFFLCGDTTHVDTLFNSDVIPYYPYTGDSLTGIRFVNLVEFSQAITVNLQGNMPSQTEFSGIQYKMITTFKGYPTSASLPGNYTFEIRDQATQNLLAVFQCYYTSFRSQTVVLIGSAAANSNYPISAFQYNNF